MLDAMRRPALPRRAVVLGMMALVGILAGPPAAGGLTAPAAGPPTVQPLADGPMYAGNAPDPSVLVVDGTYYAYTTNDGVNDVPVLTSTDMVHWQAVGDVMPVLPSWVQHGYTWSPSVAVNPAGGYQLFFDAYDATDGVQCIGRATSPSPLGPFVDPSPTPFLCQQSLGGSIDASVYRSRHGDVLVWKSDGVDAIWAEDLGPGDRSLVGSPTRLLTAGAAWEGGVVEGPALAVVGGTVYLFFSGNRWTTAEYAIGAVACASPLGPCQTAGAQTAGAEPVLATGAGATGPGGPSFFWAAGHLVMAYAAWVGGVVGGERGLYLASVSPPGPS